MWTVIIGLVVFIIFMILEVMAQMVLADTGSISKALNIFIVFNKISPIGWGKYVGYIILISICARIIEIIGSLISVIPVV